MSPSQLKEFLSKFDTMITLIAWMIASEIKGHTTLSFWDGGFSYSSGCIPVSSLFVIVAFML